MLQGMVQVALVAGPVAVCLPVLLGRHGIWFGAAVAGQAVGAIIAAGVSASAHLRRPGAVAMTALLSQVPQLISLAVHAHPAIVVVFSVVAGVGLSTFAVLWITALQQCVAPEQLGRVFAMDQLTATALSLVGLAAAGWLITGIGVSLTAWVATVVLVGSVLAVLPVAGVLDFRDPPSRNGSDHTPASRGA